MKFENKFSGSLLRILSYQSFFSEMIQNLTKWIFGLILIIIVLLVLTRLEREVQVEILELTRTAEIDQKSNVLKTLPIMDWKK